MTNRSNTDANHSGRPAWLRPILMLFACLCGIALTASATYLVLWQMDNHRIQQQTAELAQVADVHDVDDDHAQLVGQDDSSRDDPYWDYVKMKLIDVDFSKLKARNDQAVGWIQVGGTNINYPFVQTDNNDYYLTHDFDKKYNAAGWVYMDYRNSPNGNNKNTIIYAHSRLDQTMFGSLKNILTNGWLNNTDNYVVKLSTESENTLWQVFSVYHIPTTNDYLQTQFASSNQFEDFANMLKDRSAHDFHTNVSADDRILTLSTCYGYTDRVVLHAKLIKVETK